MSVVYWRTYTTKLTGFVARSVQCDHCREQYLYDLYRQGKGYGISPFFLVDCWASQSATRAAHEDLKTKLEKEIDLVPCPTCFRYQADMVRLMKRRACAWMRWLALLSLLPGLAAAGLLWVALKYHERFAIAAVASAAGSAGWLTLRRLLAARRCPAFGTEEHRKKLAWTRAYRLVDAARLMADRPDRRAAVDGRAAASEQYQGVAAWALCAAVAAGVAGPLVWAAGSKVISILQSDATPGPVAGLLAGSLLALGFVLFSCVQTRSAYRRCQKTMAVVHFREARQTWRAMAVPMTRRHGPDSNRCSQAPVQKGHC